MSENKDPKLANEEEDKKKKAATWLPGSSTVNRGKFGTMLSRGGPLGKILASKAGVLGLALGVTALASLAGVMIAKQDPADMNTRTAPKVASRAAKYYTPSGARSSNRSSLSLIAGNQDYGQEVARASAEPEEAVEEAMPEVPAMPNLPSAAKGRKFSSSGLGGSGGGGGGSSAVMRNKSSSNPAQNAPASSNLLSDAFNSAKVGSGVRGTGMTRSPERAASGKTGSRQAVSTQQMQAAALPAGAELAGALEKRKAKSGEVFGEGVTPSAGSTKAASGGDLESASSFNPPEASDDSSTDASSGGGGGGGDGGAGESNATCDASAASMDRALGILQKSIGDLADMTAKDNKDSLDRLCDYNQTGEKDGLTDQSIANINGALNDLHVANEKLTEEGCQDAFDNNGWSCGVINKTQTVAAAFVEQAERICTPYYAMRKLDEMDNGSWLNLLGHSQKYYDKKKEYKEVRDSDDYKNAVKELAALDEQMNGSDSDATGSVNNEGLQKMKDNYHDGACEYDDQEIETLKADEQEVEAEPSLLQNVAEVVAQAADGFSNGVQAGASMYDNGVHALSGWVSENIPDPTVAFLVDKFADTTSAVVHSAADTVSNIAQGSSDVLTDVADGRYGDAFVDAVGVAGDFFSGVGDAVAAGWNALWH